MSTYGISQDLVPLAAYVQNQLIQNVNEGESNRRVLIRRALQIGGLAAVAIGRTGVMMICIKGTADIFGKEDVNSFGVGVASGVSNVLVFGVLSAYSTLQLIKDLTLKSSAEEEVLLGSRMRPCLKKIMGAAFLAIGMFSQVPIAYAASASSFYAPTLNGTGQEIDFGKASFSLFRALTGMINRSPKMAEEQKLLASKLALIEEIKLRRESLAVNGSKRDRFLESMESFSPYIAGASYDIELAEANSYIRFLETILNFSPDQVSEDPVPFGLDVVIKCGTLLMTAAILSELFALTRDEMGSLSRSEPFGNFVASITLLTNIHIWLSLIHKSTFFVVDFFRKKARAPITAELMPRTYQVSTYLGTALSTLTFVPNVFLANRYFPKGAAYPIGILSSLGTILGGVGATHALRDLLIRYLAKKGTGRQLVQVDEQLASLAKILRKTSAHQYINFLSALPDALCSRIYGPKATLPSPIPFR